MEPKIIIKEVCPTSTQELIQRGYLLLDIREVSEVEKLSFDVPRILYIPMSSLEDRIHELPKDEKVIVVYTTGERSKRVVSYLQYHGYSNYINMKKGIEKWVQKGFPTKGDTSYIPSHTCCGDSHCH
jgi:rhodanese-related sulfurtransferase